MTEVCCNCSVVFAMPQEMHDRKQKDKTSFYCPNGHAQSYVGETEEVKLRRERDRLKQNAAYLEDSLKEARLSAERERHRANGYKGHATKMSKRAKAGVCPCCNRTFSQLARHMQTQHPQFTPLEIAEGATVQ